MQHRASSITPPSSPPPDPEHVPPRRKAPLAGIVFTAAAAVGILGWTGTRVVVATSKKEAIAQQRSVDAERSAATAKAPPKVRVVSPTRQTWAPVIELDGTLSAGQSAELGFKAGGRLSQVAVKVGDTVKAGALLGVLDSNEASAQLRAAQAQVRAAEAQLALADDAERRTSSMVASGSLSEASGVQTAQQKALAQAQADSARAQVSLIQVTLGNHRLVAPFSGSVTRAPEGIGSVVAPGAPQFEVVDLSSLKLKGTLSEHDAMLVQPGAAVEIITDKGTVEGKLTTVLGSVDPTTRRVRVEAVIDNDNDKQPKLFAGSFARGRIRAGNPIEVLKLPHDVLKPGGQDEVLVVEGDRVAPRRIVYTVDKDGALLVRSGLSDADRVIVAPKPEFERGLQVNVDAAGSKP